MSISLATDLQKCEMYFLNTLVVGLLVGRGVGTFDGLRVGAAVGAVGPFVGAYVGCIVGAWWRIHCMRIPLIGWGDFF